MEKAALIELRKVMNEKAVDVLIIPTDDYHQSEYVGEFFKARAYVSGFTGSYGTLVVTPSDAFLWTDGRYFIQAQKQLEGTGIKLMEMGEKDVPEIEDYIAEVLPEGGLIAFDGRVMSFAEGKKFSEIAEDKKGKLMTDTDFPDLIWEDRPTLSKEKAFYLEEKYTGELTGSKLERIRNEMAKYGADGHLIGSLDDTNWILNIRGNDIRYSPMVLSYLYIGKDSADVFIDGSKLNDEIRKNLEENNIEVHPYDSVYEFISKIKGVKSILINPGKMNFSLVNSIPRSVELIERVNPSTFFKAVKNETEIENIKKAHIKDGVAWVKYMYWTKNNIGSIPMTEISSENKLEEFRKEQPGYLWPSFAPICGYGPHGAIVHYESTEESDVPLEAKGLLLSDTGANYYEGSTDITRTLVLGEISEEARFHFTLILKSNLALSMGKFIKGASGFTLDMLARKPLWDNNLNFNHGTGHGVGYLLNIHEGPSGFRYKIVPSKNEDYPIEAGMIITVEPGIYIENQYGIRLENEVLVKNGVRNEYGQFMYFEPVTLVPFDMEGVDTSLLTSEETEYLNTYHRRVFDMISPYLEEDEKSWLGKITAPIGEKN